MTAAALHPLAEAFAFVRAWVEGAQSTPEPARTSADVLAEIFGLDAFERNVVLLGAYAALEPEGSERIGQLHGDPMQNQPSFGLAAATLPGAHWSAFAPASPLRREGLIELDRQNALAGTSFSLAEPVLFFLLGEPVLTEELAAIARVPVAAANPAPARQRFATAIANRIAADRDEVLMLCGGDSVGKEQAAALACATTGRALFAINALTIPTATADIARFARSWRRDLQLLSGWLLVEASEVEDRRALLLFADLLRLPFLLSAPEAVHIGGRSALRLDMPRAEPAEHAPIWRAALGPLAARMNGSVERLSNFFNTPPETVATIASDLHSADTAYQAAKRRKKRKTAVAEPDFEALAWNACRQFARPRMDDLARRVASTSGWNDLVLPEPQKDVLRAIAAQVRQRARVYGQWGWEKRSGGRGLGVSALFAGPSGAGKTMAGEVLGAELGLDVYRVDLSSIVSKWLGDTEKNLRRVFDAAEEGSVILQFDEADAIFGKRSEVKDSHDRNANIEVSYLLQRFEEYRGLTILTTNLRGNIDQAFLRRIRFIVDFTFPALHERRAIWEKILPTDTPRDGLDFTRLAQLNLTGGAIRNVAMTAAFFAADADDAVGMGHVLSAARLEYEKTGRVITDAELSGWPR
ncbi:ATP-binding protein [Sphingomonas sp. SUN039]|uniref:ATP-binding protein n=1 Tax=Sphingomonas sp. SUN039 TaxID=2937787 RepID=UPI002164A640|nr:ATP-binding protein [Sphingomonas sp. SUN039]UVO55701.1 ATP-binding protein [Sphingomonas sp. SUN039]